MGNNTPYEWPVKLEMFEGPLDLLLHLIYKNEVDIFDIPIAVITAQYLEYLNLLKSHNINVASDFLIMAATLTHIKSQMLLPSNMNKEAEEDPRVEIVAPLIEYLRIKEAAGHLDSREILGRDIFSRAVQDYILQELQYNEPELEVSLVKLIEAFRTIMEVRPEPAPLIFRHERWTVKDKAEVILEAIRMGEPFFFTDLFKNKADREEVTVTFLALLELVHMGFITISQPSPASEIKLYPVLVK